MITAIALGGQFGILTPLRRLRPVISDLVNKYGFQNRCVRIKTVEIDVVEAAQQSDSTFRAFLNAGRKLKDKKYAEVVILGGAVLSDLEVEMSSALVRVSVFRFG